MLMIYADFAEHGTRERQFLEAVIGFIREAVMVIILGALSIAVLLFYGVLFVCCYEIFDDVRESIKRIVERVRN